MSDPGSALLDVDGLTVHFPIGRKRLFTREQSVVHAVDGVSFALGHGETLGLVGESGSGKTTLGRAVLRKAPISSGRIRFDGQDISSLGGDSLRRLRSEMQMIFQDPFGSLNPRMTVAEIIAEPLYVHGRIRSLGAGSEQVADLLRRVGLDESAASRYPRAFSGGQRQRITIARALALRPKLIVADEPVSALDVSIQAQIVNLLQDIQAELGMSFLFISHDLSVVQHIARRTAIMYLGEIVETADTDQVFANPVHPYTESLLSAIPIADPVAARTRQRITLTSDLPDPVNPPSGCRFHPRCPIAEPICRQEKPPLEPKASVGAGVHLAACWMRPSAAPGATPLPSPTVRREPGSRGHREQS